MNTYTSAHLESFENTYELESITEECIFRYQLTDDELGWLEWIEGRYGISEYFLSTLEEQTIEIDVMHIGDLLAYEGLDRAPCLSDDTQLQRLIWFIGPNEDLNHKEFKKWLNR